MTRRFFVQSKIEDNRCVLAGDEAKHAIQVMRLKTSEQVELFDGKGRVYSATVVAAKKKEIELEILQSAALENPSTHKVVIATALPKGDRQRMLVEKLVEVGTDVLIPLRTTRSVAVVNKNVIGRMERQVIEACKQCGRNFLMSIEQEVDLQKLMEIGNPYRIQMFGCPTSDTSWERLAAQRESPLDSDKLEGTIVAIGPEGGFTPAEAELFSQHNWQGTRFSENVLRIETAAIVAAAMLKTLFANSK